MYTARLLGCEGDGNAGVGSGEGVVVVSVYMGGTHGSGDVLEMSVVRGVGGVRDMQGCTFYSTARHCRVSSPSD